MASQFERTVQVGDLGFIAEYEFLVTGDIERYAQTLRDLGESESSVSKMVSIVSEGYYPLGMKSHRFLRGNHDAPDWPYDDRRLPRYGHVDLWGRRAFVVSGAESIDRHNRTEGVDWFSDEELSAAEMREAFDMYADDPTELFISHTAPQVFAYEFTRHPNGATSRDLQHFFEYHAPTLWVCGHFHQDKVVHIANGDGERTTFICLAELSTITVDLDNLNIIQ